MAVPAEVLAAAAEEAQGANDALMEQQMSDEEEHGNSLEPNGKEEGEQEQAYVHPPPPYDATSKVEEGLKCYYTDCKCKPFKKWGSILDHVRNKHKRKYSELQGTYLHTMGLQDKMQLQTEKRHAKLTTPAQARGNIGEGSSSKTGPGADDATAVAEITWAPRARKVRTKLAADESMAAVGDAGCEGQPPKGSADVGHWQKMLCWVKCDGRGTPVTPVQFGGLAVEDVSPKPAAKSIQQASDAKQTSLKPFLKPGMSPELLTGSAEGGKQAGQASSAIVRAGGPHVGPIAVDDLTPRPMDMLTDVWKHQQMQQAKEEKDKLWHHDLPVVSVKSSYLNHEGVPAKGELVDGKPCKRADWPSELSADRVQVDDFKMWLVTDQRLNTDWAKQRGRDVGRLLGMLECMGNQPRSTECIVAIGLHDTYKEMFAIPLMADKYSWPLDMVDSMLVYLDYHQDLLQQKVKMQVEGPWEKYLAIISGMAHKLKGGIRKTCGQQIQKKIRAKGKEDEKAIANLPPPAVLHTAVSAGYKCLIKLHAEYHNKESMPALSRAKSTACLAGGIALDTYEGREMEWTLLEDEYMQGVLEGGQEILECEEHKTAKFYGDAYKWLSPSLKKAMVLYSQLPKGPGCTSTKFLVPAFEGVESVCLAHYLKMFCQKFLPADKTYPTCNLLRKWFHTEMKRKANNPDNIKKLMKRIDPHSDAVMDKHYMLNSPQDHIDIAKAIYHELMGEVTAWPTEEEVQDLDLAKWLEELLPNDFQEDEDLNEDDEYEEEGWEWGPLFGFSSGAPGALPLEDLQTGEDVPVLDDVVAEGLASDMLLVATRPQAASVRQGMEAHEAGDGQTGKAAAGALAARKKAMKDKHFSPQYWSPPVFPGASRSSPLDAVQSDWVMGQLAKWQDKHAGGDRTKRYDGVGSTEFYQDMRCDGIDAGVLYAWHSQAICSSHIKSKLKFGKLADAEPQIVVKTRNVGDVD
jgi:hypothetical protein